MCIERDKLKEIIGSSPKFIDPYSEPKPYYILILDKNYENRDDLIADDMVNLYFEKFSYAVDNAESLINAVFTDKFYDFYGVDKDIVSSPKEMRDSLIFGNFVLEPKAKELSAHLVNDNFMFGHFIEVTWDCDWNILDVWQD